MRAGYSTGVNLTAIPTDLAFNSTYEWQIRADNANPDQDLRQ